MHDGKTDLSAEFKWMSWPKIKKLTNTALIIVVDNKWSNVYITLNCGPYMKAIGDSKYILSQSHGCPEGLYLAGVIIFENCNKYQNVMASFDINREWMRPIFNLTNFCGKNKIKTISGNYVRMHQKSL